MMNPSFRRRSVISRLRRRRLVAALGGSAPQGAGPRFVVTCVSTADPAHRITVSLPAAVAAEVMETLPRLDELPPAARAASAALTKTLAQSPDARLRRVAASRPDIAAEEMQRLLFDPAWTVRQELLANPSAVVRIPSLFLADALPGDAELVVTAANSFAEALRRPHVLEVEADAPAVLEAAARLAADYADDRDPEVREAVEALKDVLERTDDLDPRRGLLGRRVPETPAARPGEDAFSIGLVMVEEGVDPVVTEETPVIPLGLEAVETIARDLGHDPVWAEFITRLAAHPSQRIRAEVARREGLPVAAVKLLAADRSHLVREMLLGNDEALEELDGEAILKIVADDPFLLEAAVSSTSSDRVLGILAEAFAESKEPLVIEQLAEIAEDLEEDEEDSEE
ncbi:hypothetical protein [Sutterella sp.]|uniref:hypothetical protein n=1 Tax=Sutterella sp. TaxID=1981025 RepID=UPI0026E06BD3|nr:hypothetical protein [Sutterella sp.]MDO5531669.1 hypothetical protein [Sutterella sp.]